MHVILAMSVLLALCGSDASYNPGPDWDIPPILMDLLPLLVEVGDSARTIPLGVWPLPQEAMPTLRHLVTKLDSVCDIWASARAEATSTPLRNCQIPDSSDKEECSSPDELDTSREVSKGGIEGQEDGLRRSLTRHEVDRPQEYTPLKRGNRNHWIGKMSEIFSRSPNRIASAVRGYIETLPKEVAVGVLQRCRAALFGDTKMAKTKAMDCILENLVAVFGALSSRNSNLNEEHKLAVAAAVFGENMQEGQVLTAATTMLGVHKRVGYAGITGHKNMLAGARVGNAERARRSLHVGGTRPKRRGRRSVCMAEATCALIRDFWLHPDNTRVSPCKKDVVLARDPHTGKLKTPREYVSKHWLEASQLVVYRRFVAKYPSVKVGQRSFEKAGVCKPHNVVRLTRRDNISCCCRYREDMRMVLKGFDEAREAVHKKCPCKDKKCCPRVPRTAEEKRESAVGAPTGQVCGIVKAGKSTSTFAESLLCPREGDKHRIECLLQTCKQCGGLKNFKVCEKEVQYAEEVRWSCYETLSTGKYDDEGKEVRRLQFLQKKTKLGALISKLQTLLLGHEPGKSPNCRCNGRFLCEDAASESWKWRRLNGVGDCPFLRPYAYHTFMALHQHRQFKTCITDLPLGHTAGCFDFSENHSLNIPREVQSLHWVVKQATVLVCVLWRHACKEVDGVESTAENPVVIKDYVYFISDDRKHDHRFIQYMREVIIKEYFEKRGIPKPIFIHEWADGCAGQNKCAAGFADVGNSKMEWSLGIPCQRNFFETAHAKGEQDGAGAHVKHAAAVAVISEGDKWYGKILCAADLYAFCVERLRTRADTSYTKSRAAFNQRFLYLVPEDATKEVAGGLSAVDHTARIAYKSLERTLQLHSVRSGVEGKLLVRDRTCYCVSCYAECVSSMPTSENCLESSHVDLWREVELTPATGADAARVRELVEEYASDVSVAVRRGCIIAVHRDPADRTHAYYLVKALSAVTEVGPRGRRDDYGQYFAPGEFVVSGRYFEWEDADVRDDYILDTSKKCLISCEAVRATDVRLVKRGDVYKMPAAEHERVLSLL
ncbi:hypothetical protein CYMTET_47384 [Cymbomonas tetramitiformis]|uniref:Uncharacterized protein n=1 Tax=Cymbomonas tetramitiformis TaxID=36881 RepID=A0AAE0BUD2_9CHLO|nr:hypothetical protein CYMTET_47384 [Cymbomonas tetramitiformis]